MAILILKIFHIVGFVSWFAGLFYLVRLFVYHRESWAFEESKQAILSDQYHVMADRLYRIICNPAMVITWSCGTAMIFVYGWDWFVMSHWLHLKLVFLIGLTIYHHSCKGMIKKLKGKELNMDGLQLRLYNEVPTLFLLAIVTLAVLQNITNFIYLFVGILIFGILLFLTVKAVNKTNKK